jgi:hypothetical protein
MGKTRQPARTAAPRTQFSSRTKSTESNSTEPFAPKRGSLRPDADSGSRRDKIATPATDEGVLDEWLEPDKDADLDQWLHDHGADGGPDDRIR